MMRRQSGIAVPLFSLVSGHGWGIGEFADLADFAPWPLEELRERLCEGDVLWELCRPKPPHERSKSGTTPERG